MNASLSFHMSRRNFLGASAAGVASLSIGIPELLAADKKIPVGLQLYSVRHDCEKDLPKVLETVAKIGYKGVEFAGYYGRKAGELRKLLDDNGLVCCGTHTPLETIQPQNLAATIEFNKTLGNKYLIVPWMDPKTKQGWLDMAKLFNEQSEKVKSEKMLVGYHAHSHDFDLIDGDSCWDLFFGNTRDDVVMQLDTSNCMDGKADPVAVLKKYAKRAVTIHLKEWGGDAQAVIGEGKVDFPAVFDLCEKNGVTEWYIVEHEREGNALENVRRCYQGLKKMGKV
ncbi:MAG TPA: TIM barrel protein [Candidatus Paceibacterota bacterium]|nr:TIM barrel protein [Verrucomicrobiota bacterium]HRY48917.1 TIM barrel protein [Candidatus Paceibacterota bacterium]HRZ99129.1 TIM barrel protein [Candidatus Paceibacterota bacterium]